MNREYWVAKPYALIRADSPKALGEMGVVVHPFSLPGGLAAAIEYMTGLGLQPEAILANISYHNRHDVTVVVKI